MSYDQHDQLLEGLEKLSKDKNTVTMSEFEQFMPLYRSDDEVLTDDQVKDLSERFLDRFDPYEKIRITDSGDKLLTELPPAIQPTPVIGREHEDKKNEFRKSATDDVPRYSAEAVAGLVEGFKESAKEPGYLAAVENRVRGFRKLDGEFNKLKKASVDVDKTEAEVEESRTPSAASEFDWEVE